MTASDIRKAFIDFYKQKNHAEIPPAPLVPQDPTTLFTPFGMQQLVPYLKGEAHPMGTRLVNSQPSFRSDDIEEVGDNRHTTFFEMLGNWSLGDYFKEEQLPWFFEFLTQVVKLNPQHLYVTVFEGSNVVPRDDKSIEIWQKLFGTKAPAQPGIKGFDSKVKIYTYDATKNWWSRAGTPENMPPGEIGGPDSEVFFDFDPNEEKKIHVQSSYKDNPCHVNCDCGRFIEIGNSVFMQYIKQADGSFKPLPKQNVDFGGGLERIAAASQNFPDMFEIDLIKPLITLLENVTAKKYAGENKTPMRIIADHMRAATFILASGVEPSNKLQGYFLRRLLRRSAIKIRYLEEKTNTTTLCVNLVNRVRELYESTNYLKGIDREKVEAVITQEIAKFNQALSRGLREIENRRPEEIDAAFAFNLLQTYGFPFEITEELVREKGIVLNKQAFDEEREKHKELSRTASAGMFKGGLADHSEATTKLHTATHLIHQALRQVLGKEIRQEGSNITAERLRFDFHHPGKITDEEKQKVEDLVNQKIRENLPVHKTIEAKDQAAKSGALAFFKEKYADKVSVYTIGRDPNSDWFSKELCGGPHVSSTGQIGSVTIKKVESIGATTRRLYAALS